MSHNPGNANERKTGQQSQDALRHQQDARHNKVHRPQPGIIDADETEVGLQPETPKVGSRDAPGG